MKPDNVYLPISSNCEKEFFETLIDNNALKIERIISKGQCSPENGWYDQSQNEWVLLLKGSAMITFSDNTTICLREGDYLHIPPHQKHKVSWTDPDLETYWLAVHY